MMTRSIAEYRDGLRRLSNTVERVITRIDNLIERDEYVRARKTKEYLDQLETVNAEIRARLLSHEASP